MFLFIRLFLAFMVAQITITEASANFLPPDALSITPQDGHVLFIDSIENSKRSIEMVMFRITDQEVVNKLIEARQRGVVIRIIIDNQSILKEGARPAFDQLVNAGIDVRTSSTAFSITHCKAATFDNQWALVTTMNLTRVAYMTRDYGIRTFNLNVVNELRSVFEADWQNSVNQTSYTPALSPPHIALAPPVAEPSLAWSPVNSLSKLVALINGAQHSIALEVENLSAQDILYALMTKAKSGVKVVAIVPACVEGVGPRNIPYMKQLLASGVDARVSLPPYTSKNPYLNGKTIVVDGTHFYIGSENFSFNSLTRAREVGIIENNPPIANVILMAINYDRNQSVPVSQIPSEYQCPEPPMAYIER